MDKTDRIFRTVKLRSGISFFSHTPQRYSWPLLMLFILMVYTPFLGNRVVRPAGDDKVYVSQALEMREAGTWFLQRLADEPNYYKGPFHYLALRLGMGFFGDSIWATVWMNLLFVVLGAWALGAIVHRNMREYDGWAFWAGAGFAASAGIYAHMFASQMEVELAGLFALGLYFLDKSGPGKPDLKFWLVAGITGWVKSPLHAVFLGSTALLFWTSQGELWARVKSWRAWLAALTGVAVCALGYLPPALLDWQNFFATYIQRETLFKPANGAPWHYPVLPVFTYSLFPWTLPAIVAFADLLLRRFRRREGQGFVDRPGVRRVLWLGASLVVPSVLFFLWHPYRGQNYNLPVVGGLFLLVAGAWATRSEAWRPLYSLSMAITSLLLLAVPILLTFVTNNFEPMPFWWPSWLLPALWLGFLISARGIWKEGVTFHQARPGSLARRSLWYLLAAGFLLTVLGEREMIDIRLRLKTAQANGEKFQLSYYNLQKDIWSEWGYLNFQVPHPVKGIPSEGKLWDAVERGDLILIPGESWYDEFSAKVKARYPKAEFEAQPWRRWRTKGKNSEGVPMWRVAWEEKDLSLLEKRYYMVRVRI